MSETLRCCFAIIFCLTAQCQGGAVLTIRENPAYSGERLNFTCFYDAGIPLSISINASDEKNARGFWSWKIENPSTTRAGIFEDTSLDVCLPDVPRQMSVSLSMTAAPSLQLSFSCTVHAVENLMIAKVTSDTVFLVVKERPEVPQILPNPAVFDQGKNSTIICHARGGKPAAEILLSITSRNGSLVTVTGNGSASVILPMPLWKWHMAAVTCLITNHQTTNVTASAVVMINHISCINGPAIVLDDSQVTALDCSKYVTTYPIDGYTWSVSSAFNTSDLSLISGPVFVVLPGQLGTFNCSVTNRALNKSVTVVFALDVSNAHTFLATNDRGPILCYPSMGSLLKPHVEQQNFIIGIALAVVVVIIGVILAAVYMRRHFRNGDEIEMTDNDFYVSLPHQLTVPEPEYAEINLVGHSLPPCVPVHDGVYAKVLRKRDRLLVAAEGAVANLSLNILPTTLLVEYSPCSCSLVDVLDKIGQAVATVTKFKSVALLLPPTEHGAMLSEKDQVFACCAALTGVKRNEILDFFVRLAELSIDLNAEAPEIDMLNYCGGDATDLSRMLTDMIHVTVNVVCEKESTKTAAQDVKLTQFGGKYFSNSHLC